MTIIFLLNDLFSRHVTYSRVSIRFHKARVKELSHVESMTRNVIKRKREPNCEF